QSSGSIFGSTGGILGRLEGRLEPDPIIVYRNNVVYEVALCHLKPLTNIQNAFVKETSDEHGLASIKCYLSKDVGKEIPYTHTNGMSMVLYRMSLDQAGIYYDPQEDDPRVT